MKKYIVIIALTMFSIQSFGQMDNIVGKYVITADTRVDTIEAGIDEINMHYEAYKSGKKKLDLQYVVFIDKTIDSKNAVEVSVAKEKKNFRIKNSKNTFNQIIKYDSKNKYYFTLLKEFAGNRKLIVKYDSKADKLLFFSDDYLFSELTRKK